MNPMASQKESGNEGKDVPTKRPRSHSICSQRSIPGSFEGYEEDNTVIEHERGPDTTQEAPAKEVVMKESYWKAVIERFDKIREKNREYRQREEELSARLLHAEDVLREEREETSRLRADVAALQRENSNLRHRITPEAGPAPRSPPPTQEPTRIGRISLKQPPRGLDFEVTDDEIETSAHRIIPRRPDLAVASDPIVARWSSRGDHPAKKLSGSKAREYRPWRFQVLAKFKTDSPLYPDDESKVIYALTQMEDPLFSAMQEWAIVQEINQFDDLLREIELFMGIQFQEHDAEKALLTITQKERESITEYYHRISALWNLAKTPEKQRIRKFVTSIQPGISMTLLDREFPSVAKALESARIVEERRKDVDTNYPRAFPTKNQAPSQSAPTKGASGISAYSNQSTARSGSHPNQRFGPVAKKPNGWSGSWYDPEDKPKRLTDELKKQLNKQGRCWSCRGSGHRGADDICPNLKKLNSTTNKDLLAQDSESESEKE